MSNNDIATLTDAVMITCTVSHSRGDEVAKVAREIGIAGAVIHSARGTGLRERLGILSIAVEAEKDVVTLIVASDQRDQVIHHLYSRLRLDQPGSGHIYATAIDRLVTYIPANIREHLEKDMS